MNMLLNKTNTAVLGALALSLLTQLSIRAAGNKLKAGDSFPDLAQFQLEGQLPASLKGKIVLLDFWASWCGPCKASFPVMEDLHKQFGKDGLVIIAVNLDDKRELMEEFLKSHPVSFPIVRDARKKLVGVVNISSMPSSFVLDGDGKVLSAHYGFHGDETRKTYVQEIETFLKSKAARN